MDGIEEDLTFKIKEENRKMATVQVPNVNQIYIKCHVFCYSSLQRPSLFFQEDLFSDWVLYTRIEM